MKKQYEQPNLEVTEFRFSEHIAASGGTSCYPMYTNVDTDGNHICDTGTPTYTGSTN